MINAVVSGSVNLSVHADLLISVIHNCTNVLASSIYNKSNLRVRINWSSHFSVLGSDCAS